MTQNDTTSRLSEILEDLIAIRRACREPHAPRAGASVLRVVRPMECE